MQGVETAQMQSDCLPATWGGPVNEDGEDDIIPHNRTRQAVWIAERERRLKELQELERRFMATRDPGYLKDFMFKGEFPKEPLAELIEEPHAVWDFANYRADGKKEGNLPEKLIEEHNRITREFFPGIEIREVKTIKGDPRLVYIGVTTEMLYAAINLRRTEQSLAKKIECGREAFEAQKLSRSRVPDARGR
jgi:hypothetical protein